MTATHGKVYRIDDTEVDVSKNCLRRGGDEYHLRHKTFQVLLYLLENRERLVTKTELFDNLWKDTAVTDDALTRCVMDIRRALGDDTRQPRLLKTIPKSGFRLVASVEELPPSAQTIVETEITTIEVEIKEDDNDYAPLNGGQAESLKLRNGSGFQRLLPEVVKPDYFRRRHVILSAACIFVVITLASIYLIHKNWSAKHPQAQITLPQIPGKRSIVVMHFENQSGDREIDWLREGLADMMITDLSRSDRMAVLSRQQLHQLLVNIGHDPDEKVQFAETLNIAKNSHAELIIVGHFARLEQNIRIDVQLHDAKTGNLLTTERLVVDKPGDILTQMDLLSLRVATYLGAVPDRSAQQNLASVMTDNLDAYRYYSVALEQVQRFQLPDAVKLLEKALTLDPQFAMAYARIGYIYAVRWQQYDKGKTYLEKAFQLSNRLTEKDRLYIRAWYAYARLDGPDAINSYRQLIVSYPTEAEAYQRLSWLLLSKEEQEEALAVINQGLAVNPVSKDSYNQLGYANTRLGKYAEAVAAFQRYVAMSPEDPNALDSLASCHQWFGHYDEAITTYHQALAINPESSVAIIHLGNTYFQQGRYRAAIDQFTRFIQIAWDDPARARGYQSIAWVYMKKGDIDNAQTAINQALKYSSRTSNFSAMTLALARKDIDAARRFKQQFSEQSRFAEASINGHLRFDYYAAGSMALGSGQSGEAVENFRQAIEHRPVEWSIDSFEDCLANGHLELGHLDEAIAEYERILKINPSYPLAHYHLGQAYEMKGQLDRARAEYEQFLQVWKDADQDIPELIEAKKSISNLG